MQHQFQEDPGAGAGDEGVGGLCGWEPWNPGEWGTHALNLAAKTTAVVVPEAVVCCRPGLAATGLP